MREWVVLALLGAWAGGAWAAEAGCVVKGTRALPLRVKVEGESFVFFRADEYRVRMESEPYVVTGLSPLRFRAVLGMPLPGMRVAGELKLGAVQWQRADAKLIEVRGKRALVDLSIDDLFALRTEVDCAALELALPDPTRTFVARNARVKTKLLHVGMAPADPSPIVLTVLDREHATLYVRRRQGRFAFVEGRFLEGTIAGWVPANELEEHPGKDNGIEQEVVSQMPIACRAAPEGSHPVRVVAGATVYAAPGRGAWATVARAQREWIADGAGEWVEVRSLGEHVWVRRAAVIEGGDVVGSCR